nr:PREDICTED: uncharacterized protein LOC109034428 [Bemisia tabaci]XP_018903103.1 PREDICTED: uncharacterized protein LOC109034428 [Bemisia tabaci]XP_018903104.1 PREDICTED: uncharacterized protein LOC109034428 [Bemisia tabaci]XP_018903105.1 PREDICTED: uncharacterized protein LOC109034428 [Bemisia tabaci]
MENPQKDIISVNQISPLKSALLVNNAIDHKAAHVGSCEVLNESNPRLGGESPVRNGGDQFPCESENEASSPLLTTPSSDLDATNHINGFETSTPLKASPTDDTQSHIHNHGDSTLPVGDVNSNHKITASESGSPLLAAAPKCSSNGDSPALKKEGNRRSQHVQFHSSTNSSSSLNDEKDKEKDSSENGDVLKGSNSFSSSSIDSSSSSESSSSSSDDDESSLNLCEARPPDGGWGWVVVFASFVVNLIADGVTFSFGVIFIEFVEYFNESNSKTAWIGSMFMAMPLLSGPLASFLTDRYGCRKVSIAGGLLAASGFIASAFVNSIEVLFFTFGILSGFGLSLCYVAAVVIVAYYFDKRRSFATGLSVCGSGIGTFIFAPLLDYLLAEYGWRGTTLILAGLFLNLCVCGALMRDLAWTKARAQIQRKRTRERRKRKKRRKRMGTTSSAGSSSQHSQQPHSPSYPSIDEIKKLLNKPVNEDDIHDPPSFADIHLSEAEREKARLCSSLVSLPTFIRNGEKVPLEVLELLSNQKQLYHVLCHNYPSLLISSRSFSDSGRVHEIPQSSNADHYVGRLMPNSAPMSPLAAQNDSERPIKAHPEGLNGNALANRLNSTNPNTTWWTNKQPRPSNRARLPTAYLKDLRVHRHSLTYRGAMLNINRYRLRASSCPDIYRNSMTTIAKEKIEWYAGLSELWYLLTDMLDFSHFSNIRFLLFALSNFLLYTWYDVPYVYLADDAIKYNNVKKTDATYLISAIGIFNMVGEIILGWAGDCKWVNVNVLYAISMTLCGLVISLIPLLKSYEAYFIVSGAFGLFIAANYSLTSIILVQLISLERFTNAYGLLLLVQGVANLIGPPLAGWLSDVTGTYDLSFYLSGVFIAISGLLLLVLPCIEKIKKQIIQSKKAKLNLQNLNGKSTVANERTNCLYIEKKRSITFDDSVMQHV